MEIATHNLANLNRSLVPTIGQLAPDFSLPSIQGKTIQLKDFIGNKKVVLWFSRGFTCPYCRGFMESVVTGYDKLKEKDIEIVQISPNLHQSAVKFFGDTPPPFPMVCDPDKRLFSTYAIGDAGAFRATTNMVVSFAVSAQKGEFLKTARASSMDVLDRQFLKRLHHHALTALNQAVITIDINGYIRNRVDVDALEDIPSTSRMIQLFEKG
ncbi:MAG: peroxiredoxin [Cellvibrionaceae bacterium]|jgi:peroxiredoxin